MIEDLLYGIIVILIAKFGITIYCLLTRKPGGCICGASR